MRQPISGLLIVKNEAQFIERALSSLLWCDEIIVVDALSTDETPALCLNPTQPWNKKIKFIQKEWIGFSAQRNFAIDQATHDWIFFLDGDEACSGELSKEILNLLKDAALVPAQFKVRRQEFFLKKPIRYGIWNPSYSVRLFYKKSFRFIGEVHEGVSCPYELKTIHEPIIHVEDLRIERILTKLNHYTTLQAEHDYETGMRTNFFKIFLSFPAMFYKNYFYYESYRDGKEGLIISTLEGISRLVRHLKIWQLGQVEKKRIKKKSLGKFTQ